MMFSSTRDSYRYTPLNARPSYMPTTRSARTSCLLIITLFLVIFFWRPDYDASPNSSYEDSIAQSSSHLNQSYASPVVPAKPVESEKPIEPVKPIETAKLPIAHPDMCRKSLDFLDLEEHAGNVVYSRQCIRAVPKRGLKPESAIDIGRPMFDTAYTLDTSAEDCALPICNEPFEVYYPETSHKPSENASSLLFGAATSMERLDRAFPFMQRWLAGTGSTLVVIVTDNSSASELQAMEQKAGAVGVQFTLLSQRDFGGEQDPTALHFKVVQALSQHRQPHHDWFGIIDDDTFFTSLSALLDAVKPYDPEGRWYLGALSESWYQVSIFGMMAYGGAGIFLSGPVLEALHTNLDVCTGTDTGDRLFMSCLYNTVSPPVQLTILPGLNQMDIDEPVDGWYENGRKPILSLHHYDGWAHVPVHLGHEVTGICGHDCFLQRYRFADDVVLTNGFSAVRYPQGLAQIDLGKTEATFVNSDDLDGYAPSLGQLRPKLSPEEKVTWRMEHAVKSEDGRVRQFYIRRRDVDGAEEINVLEIDWSA